MFEGDRELARYSAEHELDPAVLAALEAALLAPQSPELAALLALGGLGHAPESRTLIKQARENDFHRFYSEAFERGVIATSLTRRLRAGPPPDPCLFSIWQICETCVQTFAPVPPGFTPDAIDRLLRARVLATEDIGASNFFIFPWPHLKAALEIPADVSGDAERTAHYRILIARLERSAAETAGKTPGDRSALFFKNDDYAILDALKRSVGGARPSAAMGARNARGAELESRRAAVIGGISPVWRELFVTLLDLPQAGEREQAGQFHTAVGATLSSIGVTGRSTALHELALLRFRFPGALDRSLDEISHRPDGSARAGLAQFYSWGVMARLAEALAGQPVTLDDRGMAEVLAAVQNWRELAQFTLLESAGRTLQSAPGPLTPVALRALARYPSHAIVPGKADPNHHEGDEWWNGAPPMIAKMLDLHDLPLVSNERPTDCEPVARMRGFPR